MLESASRFMATTKPADWQPVARAARLAGHAIIGAQLFDRDLVLFRTKNGDLGLISAWCAHLGVTLEAGWVDADAIRCGYHGWAFDLTGRCTHIPGEPDAWKDGIQLAAYPVRESGGIIWAYGGNDNEPDLPSLDALMRAHGAGVPD